MATFDDDHAAARKAQKKQREAIRLAQLNKEKAVKALYATHEGRDYLRWILEVSKAIGHSPFRSNPHETAFLCGENNVGLQLMAQMIETDPSAFAELLKENADAARTNRQRTDDSQRDHFGDNGASTVNDGETVGGGDLNGSGYL